MVSTENAVGARRVVAGVNSTGRSAILADQPTSSRITTEAFTINQIWQIDNLPPDVNTADNSPDGVITITPPAGVFIYLVTTFPPDSTWDFEAGFARSMEDSGAAQPSGAVPGMHRTDTVDIVTVLSGEIYAVMEEGEVLLTPGDSLVQQGSLHAWRNRSDEPCSIVAVMVGATRR